MVDPGDFRSGTYAADMEGVPGSTLLNLIRRCHPRAEDLLREHGLPDAVSMKPERRIVSELAYLNEQRVYVLDGSRPVSTRTLLPIERERLDPAVHVPRFQERCGRVRRLLDVSTRLMRVLPSEAAGVSPGLWFGVGTTNLSVTSAPGLGLPKDATGVAVMWVDPGGPATNQLHVGDIITHDGDRTVGNDTYLWLQDQSERDFTVVRRGETRRVHLSAERWPRYVRFQLLDYPMPIAVRVPGTGPTSDTISVTSALVDFFTSDDQLAWIIGHEIGHVLNPAALASGQKAHRRSWVLDAVEFPIRLVPVVGLPVQVVFEAIGREPDRNRERQADRIGAVLAWRAGYQPEGAMAVIDALDQAAPQRYLDGYLSTHPSYGDRRRRVEAVIEDLRTGRLREGTLLDRAGEQQP